MAMTGAAGAARFLERFARFLLAFFFEAFFAVFLAVFLEAFFAAFFVFFFAFFLAFFAIFGSPQRLARSLEEPAAWQRHVAPTALLDVPTCIGCDDPNP